MPMYEIISHAHVCDYLKFHVFLRDVTISHSHVCDCHMPKFVSQFTPSEAGELDLLMHIVVL